MNTTQRIAAIRALVGSTIFSARFQKRTDGTNRLMVCRLRVRKGVNGRGMKYDATERGLMPVYDVQAQSWRSIPVDAVTDLTIRGTHYRRTQDGQDS